jgi:prevent-host-death family protein
MVMKQATKTETRIPAGEFKAKCLQLIDDVHAEEIGIVVTKRGVPMAKLVPFKESKKAVFRSVVGRCGPIRVVGDLIPPLPEEDTIPIDPFLG